MANEITVSTKQQWRRARYEQGICQCGKQLDSKRHDCEDCRIKLKETRVSRKTRFNYGLSREDKDKLWQSQGGNCGVCDKPLFTDICVDHCHRTGKVRGLVHNGCNFFVGFYEKNGISVESVVKYLTKEVV